MHQGTEENTTTKISDQENQSVHNKQINQHNFQKGSSISPLPSPSSPSHRLSSFDSFSNLFDYNEPSTKDPLVSTISSSNLNSNLTNTFSNNSLGYSVYNNFSNNSLTNSIKFDNSYDLYINIEKIVNLPVNCSYSRLKFFLVLPSGELLDHSLSFVSYPQLSSSLRSPNYNLKFKIKGELLHPTQTLIIKLETLELPSLIPSIVGITSIKICHDTYFLQPQSEVICNESYNIYFNLGKINSCLYYGDIPKDLFIDKSISENRIKNLLPIIENCYMRINLRVEKKDTLQPPLKSILESELAKNIDPNQESNQNNAKTYDVQTYKNFFDQKKFLIPKMGSKLDNPAILNDDNKSFNQFYSLFLQDNTILNFRNDNIVSQVLNFLIFLQEKDQLNFSTLLQNSASSEKSLRFARKTLLISNPAKETSIHTSRQQNNTTKTSSKVSSKHPPSLYSYYEELIKVPQYRNHIKFMINNMPKIPIKFYKYFYSSNLYTIKFLKSKNFFVKNLFYEKLFYNIFLWLNLNFELFLPLNLNHTLLITRHSTLMNQNLNSNSASSNLITSGSSHTNSPSQTLTTPSITSSSFSIFNFQDTIDFKYLHPYISDLGVLAKVDFLTGLPDRKPLSIMQKDLKMKEMIENFMKWNVDSKTNKSQSNKKEGRIPYYKTIFQYLPGALINIDSTSSFFDELISSSSFTQSPSTKRNKGLMSTLSFRNFNLSKSLKSKKPSTNNSSSSNVKKNFSGPNLKKNFSILSNSIHSDQDDELQKLILDDASILPNIEKSTENFIRYYDDFTSTNGIRLGPHACLLIQVTGIDILVDKNIPNDKNSLNDHHKSNQFPPHSPQSPQSSSSTPANSGGSPHDNFYNTFYDEDFTMMKPHNDLESSLASNSPLDIHNSTINNHNMTFGSTQNAFNSSIYGISKKKLNEEKEKNLNGLINIYIGHQDPKASYWGILPLFLIRNNNENNEAIVEIQKKMRECDDDDDDDENPKNINLQDKEKEREQEKEKEAKIEADNSANQDKVIEKEKSASKDRESEQIPLAEVLPETPKSLNSPKSILTPKSQNSKASNLNAEAKNSDGSSQNSTSSKNTLPKECNIFVNSGYHQVPLFYGLPPENLITSDNPMDWLFTKLKEQLLLDQELMDYSDITSTTCCLPIFNNSSTIYTEIPPSASTDSNDPNKNDIESNLKRKRKKKRKDKNYINIAKGTSAFVRLSDPRIKKILTLTPQYNYNPSLISLNSEDDFSKNQQINMKIIDDLAELYSDKISTNSPMFSTKENFIATYSPQVSKKRNLKEAIPPSINPDYLFQEINNKFYQTIYI